ncbi:hypothetical protein OH76DRAFT_1422819 [Lentinus brumalis]|uniref:Uncharacterized protein n=1 Tax=Lentinus brumalis TaxID=2498619 RepID=A0A371CNT6_9APHY|nr:hypothetical protein OH76DRAFT_1422819 [Polyporus brumalis]
MFPRLPLDTLSSDRRNLPLSSTVHLPGGFDLSPCYFEATSTSEVLRQTVGEVIEKFNYPQDAEPEVPQIPSPANAKSPGVSLRPALSLRRTETLFSSSSEEDDTLSPVTSLSSDDSFDSYERALSFAKLRAANFGMGAAMKSMNATLEAEDPAADERLSTVAAQVIASISRSPPALERHFSYPSVLSESSDDDGLTDAERQECEVVTEYIKRWASNDRLDSTYWQGFTPLHLSVSVPLVQQLTVYLAEQAIRDVSAQLNLPPPLEYERARPRLTSEPVYAGSVRVADCGYLVRRAIPAGYAPQEVLEKLRAAHNAECAANERRQVQTVPRRLQSGAKRAAGTRKEATAQRDPWTRVASKLRDDLTAWMQTHDDDDDDDEAAVVV